MASLGVHTLSGIQDAASALCAMPLSSPMRTAMRETINVAYHEAVNAYDWPQLTRVSETTLRKGDDSTLAMFNAGDKNLPILPESSEPVSMHTKSEDGTIQIVTPTEFFDSAGTSQLARTGPPKKACYVGTTAQFIPTATALGLTVKCDVDTNDSALVPSVLYTRDADVMNNEVWEDINGAFSTGVALSETPSAGYAVKAVSIPAGWSGNLTIEETVAGTEVVNIPSVRNLTTPGSSSRRYYAGMLLRLWPTPAVDDSAVLVYRWSPPRLEESNDVPVVPVADFLIHMACSALRMRDGDLRTAGHHEAKAYESLRRSFKDVPHQPRRFRPEMGNLYNQTGVGQRSGGWF